MPDFTELFTRQVVSLITPLGTLRRYHPGALSGTATGSRAVALVERSGRQTDVVTSSDSSSVFAGFRFPREVISVAVAGTCATACLPRCGGVAGRARDCSRSRHHLPVGAAPHLPAANSGVRRHLAA